MVSQREKKKLSWTETDWNDNSKGKRKKLWTLNWMDTTELNDKSMGCILIAATILFSFLQKQLMTYDAFAQ